jgi:hypothetical protein
MAELFYSVAIRNKIDPNVGFILQIPPLMQAKSQVFMQLQSLCAANSVEINRSFFSDLHKLITTNGICPVTPEAFVVSTKKAITLQLYQEKREQWGIHIPYFFQTCPGSAFYIYRTSADALPAVAQILADRKTIVTKKVDGCRYPVDVHWILEHIVDGNPCYALFDLDDYPHLYQGRLTNDEIKTLITQRFPQNFNILLILAGCLDEEAVIEVRMKDRSRWDQEKLMDKMSTHFIFSLFAERDAHRKAIPACLHLPCCGGSTTIEDWLKDAKKAAAAANSYAGVPTEFLMAGDSLAWGLALDTGVLPGCSNGITTFYSKKQPTDRSPTQGFTTTLCLGMTTSLQQCPYPTPHDIRSPHLTDREKLLMLYEMSFTVPKHAMTFYSEKVLGKSQETHGDLAQVISFIHPALPGSRTPPHFMRVATDAGHVGGGGRRRPSGCSCSSPSRFDVRRRQALLRLHPADMVPVSADQEHGSGAKNTNRPSVPGDKIEGDSAFRTERGG